MTLLPPEPVVPDEHRVRAPFVPRYDDIGQTGHFLLSSLPIALEHSGWAAVGRVVAEETYRVSRILPILSRLTVEAGGAPFSANASVEADAAIQFAHTLGAQGQVERIVLNMWCSVHGLAANTHGFPIPNAGERLVAGRVFAEHVLTRPFDPPATRRVTEFEIPGFPRIPDARYIWQPPETLMQLPAGAQWLDDAWNFDALPIVFGTDRTDSNMHVNSLVYPKLFIDAVLRRLWDHEKRFPMRGNVMEMAFRKPSFSGDRVHLVLRAYTFGEKLGACVVLIGDDETNKPIEMTKPRVLARIGFVRE